MLTIIAATCLAVSGCGIFAGDTAQQVDVAPIDIGGVIHHAVSHEDGLWVSREIEAGESSGRTDETEIVHFDLLRTMETGRAALSATLDSQLKFHQDGVWFISSEPMEDVPFLLEPPDFQFGTSTLVKINSDTLTAEHQLYLDTLDLTDFQFYEDSVWTVNNLLSRHNLNSGELTASGGPSAAISGDLEIFDRALWRTDRTYITKLDLQTGDTLLEIPVSQDSAPFDSRIKSYGGKHWVSGLVQGDEENALELNLETGELSNPTPTENLPTITFESDENRWELYNDLWHSQWPSLEDGGTWHRVDLATGETIDQYDFGEWIPFHEQNGVLWLRSEQALGQVKLEDLDN